MNKQKPDITLRFPGLPVRPIGPGDDVVVSEEALAKWIDQYAYEYAERALTALRAGLPDPDDDSQFSPNGAGGWDTPTYQLAIADFMSDIDAAIAELSSHEEKGTLHGIHIDETVDAQPADLHFESDDYEIGNTSRDEEKGGI